MSNNTPKVHTIDESIQIAEMKLLETEEKINELSKKRSSLRKKVTDLKNIKVKSDLSKYDTKEGATVIMWAPQLNYHVDLITVIKLTEMIDQGDGWGWSYKGVKTLLVQSDEDLYCKSQFVNISEESLLYEMKQSETIVTTDEITVDHLLLKMNNLCPNYKTYKEYQKLFTSNNKLIEPAE